MTITKENFEHTCVLVLTEGYKVVGENGSGIIIENSVKNHHCAKEAVRKFCKNCTGCSATAENSDPATIFAKIG